MKSPTEKNDPRARRIIGASVDMRNATLAGIREAVDGTSGGDHMFHITSKHNLHDIAREGLKTHKPWHGTDQESWPDGSREKRNYFSAKEEHTHAFGPEARHEDNVVLRVHKTNHPFRREGYTGDHYSTKTVHPKHIEYKHGDNWHPITGLKESVEDLEVRTLLEAVNHKEKPTECINKEPGCTDTHVFNTASKKAIGEGFYCPTRKQYHVDFVGVRHTFPGDRTVVSNKYSPHVAAVTHSLFRDARARGATHITASAAHPASERFLRHRGATEVGKTAEGYTKFELKLGERKKKTEDIERAKYLAITEAIKLNTPAGLAEAAKPTTLYHGSTRHTTGSLQPTLAAAPESKVQKRVVFGTDNVAAAALFMFPDALCSFCFEGDDVFICIWGTQERFKDRAGYLYTLPAKTFVKGPKAYEWVSEVSVRPLEVRSYSSVLYGMQVNGVEIYFVNDNKVFDEIQAAKSGRLAILRAAGIDPIAELEPSLAELCSCGDEDRLEEATTHPQAGKPWHLSGNALGNVYHGTDRGIRHIDPTRSGERTGLKVHGKGFYTTTDHDYAKSYEYSDVRKKDSRTTLNAYKAHTSANVLNIPADRPHGNLDHEAAYHEITNHGKAVGARSYRDAAHDYANKHGYDGIRFHGVRATHYPKSTDEVVWKKTDRLHRIPASVAKRHGLPQADKPSRPTKSMVRSRSRRTGGSKELDFTGFEWDEDCLPQTLHERVAEALGVTARLDEGSSLPIKQVKRVQKFEQHGYEIRTEVIDGSHYGSPDIDMESAYALADGGYIGDPKTAKYLCQKRGIIPERSTPEHNVCSVGYNATEKKWYGWSHRAIAGFGVGSKVESGDIVADHFPVGYEATTIEDAKRMAQAFAKDVS